MRGRAESPAMKCWLPMMDGKNIRAAGETIYLSQGGAMKITTRTIGDVRILDCSGKITLDAGMLSLRNTLHDTLQSGAHKIVLNLAHTKFIDSSGIGELIHTYNSITDTGGQMRLLNLTKKISDPLVITKLLTVFKSFNDEQSAISSFN
jgi:anti-sigma B factor antagonist